ncbi:hypothetical protein JCM11491_003991 [Sporobolomyces phaffii]
MGIPIWSSQPDIAQAIERGRRGLHHGQDEDKRLQEATDRLNLVFAEVVSAAEAAQAQRKIDVPAVQALRNWRSEMTEKLGLASGETCDKRLLTPGGMALVYTRARALSTAIANGSTSQNYLSSTNPPVLQPLYVPAEIVNELHSISMQLLFTGTAHSLAKASNERSNPFRPVSRNLLVGGITSGPF